MLTKTQLKIVSYLIDNPTKLLGIRELAKEILVVYYLVQQNIVELKEKKIVTVQKAGRTSLVMINQQVDSCYLLEAERFKREMFYHRFPHLHVMLKKIIAKAHTSFFILLIFGSYAKYTSRKDSDLDLLIVVPSTSQVDEMERVLSTISGISPTVIHETIVTEKSFISMLQKKDLTVANEAKEKHILVYGEDLYYKLIT